LLHSLEHPFVTTVLGCAFQPGNEGNVLATASADGILRLFDIRRNQNGERENPKVHFFAMNSSYFAFFLPFVYLSSSSVSVRQKT